jgi:hypothetical protein
LEKKGEKNKKGIRKPLGRRKGKIRNGKKETD